MSAGLLVWSALVLALSVVAALLRARAERGRGPGTRPGQGVTLIEGAYISGGPGGGHQSLTAVPKDPQAWARMFVPSRAKKGKDRT